MGWTWRFETSQGEVVEVAEVPEGFPTQSDAETWIGEGWSDLLAVGVDQVVLLEDGVAVYGPMSLHPV
ncbi:MAG: hypothetical protein ACYCXA_04475 [Actinomycetes bacterium]